MTLSLGVIKETFQSKSEQGGDKTFLLGGADPNAIMHSFQSRLVDHIQNILVWKWLLFNIRISLLSHTSKG